MAGTAATDVVELTRALVAIDSQNPGVGEAAIADAIEHEVCRPNGFDVKRIEVAPGRPNLLVSVDRGPGPHLALSGHLDTKPVGDALAAWNSDPLVLTVDGDTAYGLGTSDMKGAVAAMLVALRRFADRGAAGTLTLVLTADEEQGSEYGAKALAGGAALPAVDAVVIGEPSGVDAPWEALYLVSRGICAFEIDLRTRQGHSGLSERLGRNAVLVAADVLHAFDQFRPPVHDTGTIACTPTVNPGMLVQGGVCFGTSPGACTVGCEIRLVPGMDRDEVRAAVEETVRAAAGDASFEIRYREGSMGWMPAVGIGADEPVVTAAQRAAERVLGGRLPVRAYPGGTDATYFMRAGIPAITSLGPGWLSVAHGPNEHVGLSQLTTAVDLYEALADEFTGAAHEGG